MGIKKSCFIVLLKRLYNQYFLSDVAVQFKLCKPGQVIK
ncbi:MAG: hypothetical protein JWQ27_240 [Ferruginibacter sp.]|nr:hypothetical protein [Ferruginibacter sp.]